MCGVPSRYFVAVMYARSRSGPEIALCFFRHFLFSFLPPTRMELKEKTTEETSKKHTPALIRNWVEQLSP